MKKTFREKAIAKYTQLARKNKLMYYPCLVALSVTVGVYHICRHFVTNTKRYASVAFVIIFFMNSCSFSFAVFAEKTGFIKAQEAYSAIVEDSDISLAVETEVNPEEHLLMEDDTSDLEYNPEADINGVDVYTLDDILEDGENYQPENNLAAEGNPEEPEEDYIFDAADWRLVLINKQHPIPEDYEFNLGNIKDNMWCDERIIEDLLLMMQAAKNDGYNIAIQSPYRSSDRLEMNFNNMIKHYMGHGMSYMDAYKTASQVITVPGCSEHEIGLALDITSDTFQPLLQEFADTGEGKWLAEHSYEYGFILRYPAGKEYITSIEYEPWHFRYVGREAAKVMYEENICLEEFWDKYL